MSMIEYNTLNYIMYKEAMAKLKAQEDEAKAARDDEIKKQLNKKFRMKGLVVADLDIVKMMDSRISPSNYSDSVPVYLDKEGNISKSKSNVLDREKFDRLQKYTKHIISEISNEIFGGNVYCCRSSFKRFWRRKNEL